MRGRSSNLPMRLRPLMLALLLLAACRTPGAVPPDRTAALTAALERLAAQHPDALLAVAVRDPATGTTVDLNADTLLHAASTMKVPVMIEVYRRAEAGLLSLDDSLRVENAFRSIVDGSPFAIEDDSDDAIYTRLGRRMAVRDLVYQMITVSSNLATNLLIDHVGAVSVQTTSERLGTRRMQTRRGVEDLLAYERGLNNQATAADLATLLEALRQGRAVSPAADAAMREVLLAQRFNSMIPAGLPPGTRVAHKTGEITAHRHDAAIVYPAQGAPYTLVVLTRGLADGEAATAWGREAARLVHTYLRGTPR